MIGWSEFLLPEEAETIRAYVAAQARTLHETETGGRATTPPAIEPPTIEPIAPPPIDTTAL
jgi:hypothetical protein